MVEVKIPQKGVNIIAKDSMGDVVAKATIQSFDAEKLTLVVSNNHPDPPNHTDVHEHFEHYYGLSGLDRSVDIFLPDIKKPKKDKSIMGRMACEQDLIDFEYKILEIKTPVNNGQHNQRECDTVAFSGQ